MTTQDLQGADAYQDVSTVRRGLVGERRQGEHGRQMRFSRRRADGLNSGIGGNQRLAQCRKTGATTTPPALGRFDNRLMKALIERLQQVPGGL